MNQIEINEAEFRKYESRDAMALKELYGQFVKYHSRFDSSFAKVKGHEDMFNNWVESSVSDETFNCMVAIVDRQVVGYCVSEIREKPPVYPEKLFGYFVNLCVSEGYQRQGLGQQLVKHVIAWFTSKGINRLEVEATVKNPKSTAFWRKMRFQPLTEQLYLNLKVRS